MNFEQSSKVVEDFINEVQNWLKLNKLAELPDYSKLKNKEILGELYTNDIRYCEQLSNYKSTFYGLISYYNKEHSEATREGKRDIENMITYLNNKSKELDTKLDSAKTRLSFYKTVIYMIGNILYGAD